MRKLWILLVVVASAVGIMMIGGAGTASACDPPNCPPGQKDDDNGHKGGDKGKDKGGDKGNACPKDNRTPPNCGNGNGGKPGGGNGCKPKKPKCPGEEEPECPEKPECPDPDPDPPAGNCEGADIEVLPDLTILCAYAGAVTQEDLEERCPDATIVLPSPIGGLCVFLPPADEEAAARV